MTASSEILVTGATGLVGTALAEVTPSVPLSRRAGATPRWEPLNGIVHDDGRALRAVVHLAGENIAGGRWTAERRMAIETSRIRGTRTLVEWMTKREAPPEVFVCASAVGIYGSCADTELPESSPAGEGFLADLCERWETEARRAEEAGIRVVRLRLGLVLARSGGVLGTLLPLFKLGAGGPVGSGRQWFPWVHVRDVVGAIAWSIEDADANGAYNVVAPGIVRQRDFARALGRALSRPARLPAPAFALRMLMGEMADEALLASQRAVPERLRGAGYSFAFPDLAAALSDLLATGAARA